MRVALCHGDVAVARQFLGQLQIPSRPAQHRGHKIMSEGVGGDGADARFPQGLAHAFGNNILPCACSNGFGFLSGPAVVPGKDGEGGQVA